MANIDVSVDNMSFGSGLVSEIGVIVRIDGEEYYFCVDDIEFSIDDIDYEIGYQDREPDVGIDWEGKYIEDFDLKDSVVVDNIYPLDEDGSDDISNLPKAKKVMEEYREVLKSKVEELITDRLYKKYDQEIEEWLLEYVNNQSDYEPDYDDYYND